MIIEQQERKVIRDEDREKVAYSVDESSLPILFNILRKKLYSDPIGSIVREYVCNAIDANVENNKTDIPIKVKITEANALLGDIETFSVEDCGVGISPERMANIFCKYAASTKRETNDQIGGFGLGSKTFFAYRDSFFVHTWVDGTEYMYKCFIDETEVGAIELLWTDQTEHENGTEIIGLIQKEDRYKFVEACNQQLRFIGNIQYEGLEVKPYEILEETENYIRLKDEVDQCILIGNIKYKVNFKDCYSGQLCGYNYHYKTNIIPKFKIGEISVTASREAVEFDTKGETKNKISDKITSIREEFQKSTEQLLLLLSLPEIYDLLYVIRQGIVSETHSKYYKISNTFYDASSTIKSQFLKEWNNVNKSLLLFEAKYRSRLAEAVINNKKLVFINVPKAFHTNNTSQKIDLFKDYCDDNLYKDCYIYYGEDEYDLINLVYSFCSYPNRSNAKKLIDIKDYLKAIKTIVKVKGLKIVLDRYDVITKTDQFIQYYKENVVRKISVSVSNTIEYRRFNNSKDDTINKTTDINDAPIKVYCIASQRKVLDEFANHIYHSGSNDINEFLKRHPIVSSDGYINIPIIRKNLESKFN
jgi:hypothetical protein